MMDELTKSIQEVHWCMLFFADLLFGKKFGSKLIWRYLAPTYDAAIKETIHV